MNDAVAIQSDRRDHDVVLELVQSAIQQILPKALKVLIAQYAVDTLYADFMTMLLTLRIDNLVNEHCPALSTSSYVCRLPLETRPGWVDTRLVRLHAGEVYDPASPLRLQVFSELPPAAATAAPLLSVNCRIDFVAAPAIIKELWNFMCGGAAPAALLTALAAFPGGDPVVLVELLCDDLRLKAARWCSMRECAAVARVRLGVVPSPGGAESCQSADAR
jgi:hypothetical protein